MNTSKQIAQYLLEVGAVTLSPDHLFTWASGIKSPIYCDNRITMSYPQVRKFIAESFANEIKTLYPEVDYIVGTATAGIPQACWVSDLLDKPMAYVRPKPKDHGKGKQIEGMIPRGSKVIVIEDLISTGGSCIKVCDALEAEGIEVLCVYAVFTYELKKALVAFNEANITLHTLSNYSTLIQVAREMEAITDDNLELLQSWAIDPSSFK
ncbi:orotate phosphoribosyltransferase [Erysipelothrix rhusiopathiae]|uniref:orotate phosphoribosyltransferase n=1 Tax=Erysipelothrix rhusiopathiae TaxID=1648 RepID=UPI0039EFC45F